MAVGVTIWNRLEPRPRSNDFRTALAAQVRDPAWFLCRQWQTGELAGQDAGSPAFITVATTTAPMTAWSAGGKNGAIDPKTPLERQVLAEPFSGTDLSIAVEIGQTFRALLSGRVADPSAIYASFLASYPIGAPQSDAFAPFDAATAGFLTMCAGQALNGTAIYGLAKQFEAGGGSLPSSIPAGDVAGSKAALAETLKWVRSTWGDLSDGDPIAWAPDRLEYRLQVQGVSPTGSGIAFDARPDERGELPWSAFDVASATPPAPSGVTPTAKRTTVVPGHVRFRSMPAPRFWDFETNELALPDVKPEITDINKVLALDFVLIHGADWFIAPLPQALGTLSRVDALVVTDVFGTRTGIDRADLNNTAPGPNRWSLYTPTTPTAVGDFFVASPTAGSAVRVGQPIEDVRFARDEMVDMAWAIERATPSPIGQPRAGAERDAAVDAIAPVTPGTSTDTTSPLRYQVETKVPIHWLPLVGVRINPSSSTDPAIILQRAAMVRPAPTGTAFRDVDPLGRIMKPTVNGSPINPYRIVEEEVPRVGLVVERATYRSRWIDGSTHLWIARRRRTGSGETSSALRFDVALSTAK